MPSVSHSRRNRHQPQAHTIANRAKTNHTEIGFERMRDSNQNTGLIPSSRDRKVTRSIPCPYRQAYQRSRQRRKLRPRGRSCQVLRAITVAANRQSHESTWTTTSEAQNQFLEDLYGPSNAR